MKKLVLSLVITLFACSFAMSQIVFSEIHFNASPVQGSEVDCEFLELYNGYTNAIDLSGWSFSEGVGYVFPNGTMLASGEYLIVTRGTGNCNDYDLSSSVRIYTGALNNGGEAVTLNNICGNVVTTVTYSDSLNWAGQGDGNADGGGQSLQLTNITDDANPANWTDADLPTPESGTLPNGILSYTPDPCFSCDEGISCLVITEIMIDPCSGAGGFWANEGQGEFIEIYNHCGIPVNISGYQIKDEFGTSGYVVIPDGTTLDSGQYLVVGSQAITDSLDKDGNHIMDNGTALVYGKDNNASEIDNTSPEGITLNDCSGNLIDAVSWTSAGCMISNDGISAVLLSFDSINTNIDTANWFASLAVADTISGGGSPGEPNKGGACINAIAVDIAPVCNQDPECGATFTISFDYEFSSVTTYDVYIDSVFLDTIGPYAIGAADSVMAEITLPCPVDFDTVKLELRPIGAVRNPCYAATEDIPVPECVDNPLPVELIAFDAKAVGCDILINWQTAIEENFERFELERSSDGIRFETITVAFGEGGLINQHYQHFDRNAITLNYYRLKMIDLDGSFNYSTAILVTTDCGKDSKFILYPNPISEEQNEVTLKFFTPAASEQVAVTIQDIHGKILDSKIINTVPGWNSVQWNVRDLPAGVFFFTTRGNGSKQITQRLIRIRA
ncbi:MAG: hypothetical protein ACI8VT_003154 [Saprospiraceae bacterium]|jgi:hypothetical protein